MQQPPYRNGFDTVAVIQSLRRHDEKTGTKLVQEVIGPECSRAGIQSWFYDVESGPELLRILAEIAKRSEAGDHSPVLHLETHGGQDGLQTTNLDLVKWEDLREPFERLNTISRLNLLVTLAACNGAELVQILTPVHRAPVWGLIGPKKAMKESELLVDYSAFFTEFIQTQDGLATIKRLNGGAPATNWRYTFVACQYVFKTVYAKYLADESTPEAIEQRSRRLASEAIKENAEFLPQLDRLAALAKARLLDHRSFFEGFKTKYFMLDLFPDNAERFDISIEDLAKFTELGR